MNRPSSRCIFYLVGCFGENDVVHYVVFINNEYIHPRGYYNRNETRVVMNEETGVSHAYSFQFLSIVSDDGTGIPTVLANEPPYRVVRGGDCFPPLHFAHPSTTVLI
jgi:hypothetical protein